MQHPTNYGYEIACNYCGRFIFILKWNKKVGVKMKPFLYSLYIVAIAVLSVFTGEMVTFIMLGFILLLLQNIHTTLKKLLSTLENKND